MIRNPAILVLALTAALAIGGTAGTAQTPTAPTVPLTERDLVPVPLGWIAPNLRPPAPNPAVPIIAEKLKGEVPDVLRTLAARRRVAGFGGMIYDNRDRGHSSIREDWFPALARLAYGPDLVRAGFDYGLGGLVILPAIVIGNSSTAIRGKTGRSLPRLAMTSEGWPQRGFRTYVSNAVYVYPEHRDHDAADLFPANWPYMVTSQGSSGSDQPFLRAIAMTLAAFPPDTRDRLQREGLIAPTIQMILRRSQKQVTSREAYFSGVAHPSAFDAEQLVPQRMLSLAAAMRPETIPPMVRLTIVSEDFRAEAGLARLSERLFDTPSAIARIWRGPEGRHEMVISAAETRDPNGRALRFRWELLRGDPARVRIEPLDEAGTAARLVLDWQQVPDLPAARPDQTAAKKDAVAMPRTTTRVDIGIFASNGAQDSAPAFVSVSFPAHELRRYEAGPDGTPRIASIDYDALGRKAPYDFWLHWSAPWRDVYLYGPDGTPQGWTRERDGLAERFDAAGRRTDGSTPSYRLGKAKGSGGNPVLEEATAGSADIPPPDSRQP